MREKGRRCDHIFCLKQLAHPLKEVAVRATVVAGKRPEMSDGKTTEGVQGVAVER